MSRSLGGENRPDLLRGLNLIWYPITLVPILALAWLGWSGVLPGWALMFSIFFGFFWLFSLLFALYVTWTKRGERR